jgi:hypothetical protein
LQEIDPSLSEPERIKKAIKQLSQSSWLV